MPDIVHGKQFDYFSFGFCVIIPFLVIDFCLTKTMVVNPITKYQSLQLEWASHVNCTQRAGRVGRLSHGRVYRLVPRDFYEVRIITQCNFHV